MSNGMNITQSLDTSSEIISQNLCTHLHLTPTPSIIEKYHPLPGPCQPFVFDKSGRWKNVGLLVNVVFLWFAGDAEHFCIFIDQ